MKTYHGSTFRVEHPVASACRDNLDFGKGFYITDLKEQAERWAYRVAAINKREEIFLNIYKLDMETVRSRYRILSFQAYDNAWLEFVMACRRGQRLWEAYDMIEGGVANDRVFNTVELYFSGFIAKDEALKRLSYEEPNKQLCLINQQMINDCLHFVEAIQLKGGNSYVSSK